jgi:hypothetical protein
LLLTATLGMVVSFHLCTLNEYRILSHLAIRKGETDEHVNPNE